MTDDALMKARYRRITRFAARYLVQAWWYELFLPRFGLGWISARGRTRRLQRIARRFHVLAVDLGGLMIKVGQFMSSRLDVLPPVITKELEGLQDEVPAVPFAQMRVRAEEELGMPLERAFVSVNERPLAAASLGQAHRAVLTDELAVDTGLRAVVLKIQRPDIDRIVEVDLRALRKVGVWLSRVALVRDRVDMPSLVEEFAVTSLEEIDYLHEAANSERFAADFGGEGGVAVPEVVWERTTRRVLTLEDVSAIKINDVDALRDAGIDPSEVAARFAAVMFDQLFDDGFFHADPHPGNVFVTPTGALTDAGTPAWRLTFIDFGMMGDVPPGLRRGLRRVLIAAASRDGKGLVDGIRDVGVLLPSADTIQLERAMTQLFSRFGGMGFAELQEVDPREFRAFAIEFGDVVRALPFQLPENFLLIIRAMSLTSGMCSSLDPAFNIWDAVEPYAQRLIREESGNTVQALAREVGAVAAVTARLPRRADNLISRLEEGSLSVETPRIERRLRDLERMIRRVVSSVLFAGLLVGGVLLQAEQAVLGTILMILSLGPLAHALLAGVIARRNGA
ncbi:MULTISPECIES: AarF/ABC1/UbiB kinase family protein [Microbacterium]|uniref:ABC1 kinase family protein n=1 Tax=Microbacterium TaxID=33882 RepID=UPI002781E6D5|nr:MULTISPECIES: AarF/UbiB family protein [Microbacterium]MDQ1083707.1 putative unusual protein kinase regulating ubiquinone biosynthesis (AarF/ABC1/UbiB family) [Microbacterium sp. SORGH_AS_0344]MDQ1171016.1 putative unusual protein kinase regulating ubiquinone biosynthesis (AarF/ABC1/UbiB family) [Microbacterium proteolyticum]